MIAEGVSLVAYFNNVFTFFISFSISFCFFNHTLNFVLIQCAGRSNGDFLFFASAKVFSTNIYDTVGINVESNLDFRNTTRSCRNTAKFKATKSFIISSHLAFALQDVNINGRLIVGSSREYLFTRSRNGGITINYLREYSAQSFDTQRQWSYIKKQNVFYFASQNTCLDSSANCDAFIRVNATMWFFAKDLLNSILNRRNTGRTANQDNFFNIIGSQTCIS